MTAEPRARMRARELVGAEMVARLRRAGLDVVARGQHHEGPLHPEHVHGERASHLVTVDGEIIGGPWPADG